MTKPVGVEQSDLLSKWWFRGLPAIGTAVISTFIALYLAVFLPSRLPAHYEQLLDETLARYEAEASKLSERELVELGSEVSIAYSRVQSFRDADPTWEEAEFYHRHLSNLAGHKSAAENDKKILDENLIAFRGKRDKLLESFSHRDSPFSRSANLLVAEEALTARSQPANKLIENLEYLFEQAPSDAELGNTLVRVLLHKSWHPRGKDGRPMASSLNQASEVLSRMDQHSISVPTTVRLELLTFADAEAAKKLASAVTSTSADHSFESVLRAQAILGNWKEAQDWLSQRLAVANKDEELEVRSESADFILQLFLSDLVLTKEWSVECASGLQLAKMLYPANRLTPAVIWRLARLHADDQAKLAAESILLSEEPERLLLLAISGSLRGVADSERYLKQAIASNPGTCTQLGIICVAEPIEDDEVPALIRLLEPNTSHTPELHLALAKLFLQLNDLPALKKQLDAVRVELGETPLFKQLDSQANRSPTGP